MKVLGMGDNVCDVYLHTQTMYPGGQALNFAVYANFLGMQSDYMGVFGDDSIAQYVQSVLDDHGIGRSHCREYAGENGFARVTLVDGDRVFKGSNRGGVLQEHPIYIDEADAEYIDGFRLVHTTNNGFMDSLLPKLGQLSPMVSYDFSYRWTEEDRVERVCPYVDFAFLSCSELSDAETVTLCRRLCEKGCGIVTATRGSKGALVYDGKKIYEQAPKLVNALDTMGAGDSFATAMLVKIVKSLEADGKTSWKNDEYRAKVLPEALHEAAEFAASTCLVSGAFGCGTRVPNDMYARIVDGI